MKACSVSGCDGKYLSKGYCGKHYQRVKKFGDPNAVIQIQGDDDARFDSYVELIPESGCHWWVGGLKNHKYGAFSVKQKHVFAHRFAYQRAYGPIPAGALVCHSCDNPDCVNPEHLWVGTHKDNMLDMRKKGRAHRPQGALHARSKLNDEAVKVIRHFRGLVLQKTLADAYGVSVVAVCQAQLGDTWRHV